MKRTACWFLVFVMALAVAAPVMPAHAQANLFELLFKRKNAAPKKIAPAPRKVPAKPAPSAKRTTKSRSSGSAPATAAASSTPKAEPVEKLENARVVLVVGDFMAGGLADGLVAAFEDSPGVRIVDRSNGSSGFVRQDYYDWIGEMPALLEAEKPAVVIMMIGSNDRQSIGKDGVLSTEWTAEYGNRINAFAKSVRETGLPLLWVGAPSFKARSMTTDMLAFNDMYRNAVEAVSGEFVDIWDGFVDADGNFVTRGPDINGQVTQLRGSDGINLTRAGRRKVAFYVEKPLRRLLGDATQPGIGLLNDENLSKMTLDPLGTPVDIDRTPPISMADPELDGGAALLGETVSVREPGLVATPTDQFLLRGIPLPPSEGRVDDFRWKPETTSGG